MNLVPDASQRTRTAGVLSPHGWSARLLVSVLIPCLAFSTWVPLLSGCRVQPSAEVGNADLVDAEDGLESESRFAPSPFELRLELPENGRFDLYHSVHSLRGAVGSDAISGSVYAMRTLVVKDLLKTRAALKAMLGGTARARQVTRRADLSFAVPASVKQLYLIGPGSARVTRPSAHTSGVDPSVGNTSGSTARGGASSPADTSNTAHGFETEVYFGDIARSIRWIENTEVQPNADYSARRFRLAAGIIYLSANLARLDRHLKFIDEDYWRNPEIRRQFFRAERSCIEQNTFETEGGGSTEESAYLTCRTEWMTRHGMDQVKQRILVLKALIAERHNILSVDLGSGEYLYQAVYSRLIAAAGFPDPATPVRPTVLRLPTGEGNRDPIPLSTTFEDEIESRLESLSEPHDRGRLEALLRGNSEQVGIATLIDRALEKMLLANEDSLERLCSAIEYRVEWTSPLVQLARYPELWEEAKSQFAYLGGLLDFDSAQAAFSNYFRTDHQERTQLRYATYAGVIGLTVAALFSLGSTLLGAGALSAAGGATASVGAATGTTAASSGFMGLSAGTWMTGIALASTGIAGYGAYRSHEDSRLSNHLFLGSRRSGSSVIAARDRVMSREDYQLFISSATHLFFRVPWIEAVVAVARPVGNGIVNGAVALAETERGIQVAQWMAAQGTRINRLSRVFPGLSTFVRALGRSLETPLGLAAGTTQTLEQAIQSLSLSTGLARTAIVNRLSRIPLLASIFGRTESGVRLTELADRVFVQSGYLRYLINEEVSDVMVSVPVQLLSSEAPIDYSSMDRFVQSTSRAGVWRNLRISMTEVVAMASIVYLPVMRRAYRSAQATGSATLATPAREGSAPVPTPDSDQTLPPTIFDSNLDPSARMRHFARNASLFGMVGFSSGFLGTFSTNQRDAYGRERSIRDRVDQAASRGLYEMGFFALSANTQMQLTAYINTRLLSISQRREGRMEELRALLREGQLEGERLQVAARELRMLENGRLVLGPAPTAISTTSDATSWWLYVTLLHLTGADQSNLQVPIRSEGDQVNVRAEDSRFGDLSIETIGHAYLRRTDRGDLLAPWQAEEPQDRDHPLVPMIPAQSAP